MKLKRYYMMFLIQRGLIDLLMSGNALKEKFLSGVNIFHMSQRLNSSWVKSLREHPIHKKKPLKNIFSIACKICFAC